MTDTPVQTTMTVEQFLQLNSDETPFELIDGERVPLSPTTSLHDWLKHCIFLPLAQFVMSQRLGMVFMETTFILPIEGNENWVVGSRQPDVMFVSQEKLDVWRAIEGAKDRPYTFVPELVVEILSPSDSFSKTTRKVDVYLRDGVQLVWLVEPEQQKIWVYAAGQPHVTLSTQDMLTGGSVLPEFSISLTDIFKPI